MTTAELNNLFALLGVITLADAEQRWGIKNMRQNSADHPPRVRLPGGRDWLTTETAVRAVYGPPLAEIVATADNLTDGGRHDPTV